MYPDGKAPRSAPRTEDNRLKEGEINIKKGTKKKQHTVKTDIVLAGVGGQGILSVATILGVAALKEGLNIKQAEVHGMSQRGGDVQSTLRISSNPIHSDLIPSGKADLIVSLEPMEALRYHPTHLTQASKQTKTKPKQNKTKKQQKKNKNQN